MPDLLFLADMKFTALGPDRDRPASHPFLYQVPRLADPERDHCSDILITVQGQDIAVVDLDLLDLDPAEGLSQQEDVRRKSCG